MSGAGTSQGLLATPEAKTNHKTDPPLEPSGSKALPTPYFGPVASGTEREYISAVLRHSVCSHLLWQLQETNSLVNVSKQDIGLGWIDKAEGPFLVGDHEFIVESVLSISKYLPKPKLPRSKNIHKIGP